MTRATLTVQRKPPPAVGPDDDSPSDSGAQQVDEALDDLAEETGLDLSDASELDADHVPSDEESDRVLQAPD